MIDHLPYEPIMTDKYVDFVLDYDNYQKFNNTELFCPRIEINNLDYYKTLQINQVNNDCI